MAKDTLAEYSAKRTFDATPEPRPAAVQRGHGPLLFVIQQHAATRLHFDLRLECDGVLKSWAVPKGPSLAPGDKRLAMPTEDHPFEYASFEGVIPKGQYGAGEVIVWDCGVYSPDEGGTAYDDREAAERRVREDLAKGKLSIELRGEKVKGSFALVRTRGRGAGDQETSWLLLKHRDRFATGEDLARRDRSVLSGISVDEMATLPAQRMPAARLIACGKREAMPAKLEPMHAESSERPFNDPRWAWEPKLDGYRVLAFVDGNSVRLKSRRGLDLSTAFPGLCDELASQGAGMVLDGEVVAFDEQGRASFNALQNRVQLRSARDIAAADRASPAVFVCFDLLHFAGIDVRASPYRDRRRYLAQCLMPSRLVQLVHASEDGVALNAAAIASGFEGVVGKRLDSRYEPGARSPAWVKVKPTTSADFVIGGYTQGKGARAKLGAILVGYRNGGKLHFASHVGSGFDDRSLAQVTARLAPLRTKACPFAEKPPQLNAPATWVEPKLVAEVSFQDWTADGSLRAPVFLRLRDDVDAKAARGKPAASRAAKAGPADAIADIVAQLDNAKASLTLAIGAHRVKLTNLDRVYWPANPGLKQPALAKRDLVRYLAQVSPLMLPHLADRPLTMIRMPEGIGGERFFQKHWAQERPPFVETITVFSEHKDESHDYLLCNNLATLLWLAQAGTLEFHVWHSRATVGPDAATRSTDFASSAASMDASILNYPDYVVFDIDPYIYSGKEAPGEEPELNTVAFEKGKEVAFHLKELLQSMSLEAVVKTSGKTGLHIFVPVCRTLTFDEARRVSEMVGRHLMSRHPKDITLEWKIPKRTGKIFMDYNMNVRGKTLNVAYSPRGVPGAPVSMPLTWKELERAHPLDFRLTNAIERLARTGDRWSEALTAKQRFEETLSRARK